LPQFGTLKNFFSHLFAVINAIRSVSFRVEFLDLKTYLWIGVSQSSNFLVRIKEHTARKKISEQGGERRLSAGGAASDPEYGHVVTG
jgi:hypothetical protein